MFLLFLDHRKPLSPHMEEQRMDFPPRPTKSACEMSNNQTPNDSSYSQVTVDQTPCLNGGGSGYRTTQIAGDRLTKSYNSDQLGPSIKQFRTHRRINSHEDVSFLKNFALQQQQQNTTTTATTTISPERHSSTLSDKSSSSRLSNSSSSISNRSEEEDNTTPPRINETPSDYYSHVSADQQQDELPAGWQEVKDEDGNETYYWHIWTGTIQYERPTALMVRFFSSSLSLYVLKYGQKAVI